MNRPAFHFTATGVGSVPGLNIRDTCRLILERLPDIPFWPQFVNLDPREDMIVQYGEGLPGIRLADDGRALFVADADPTDELTAFYERYLEEDVGAFAISPERAHGLYDLLDHLNGSPAAGGAYIKGQSVGPVTFASAVRTSDGRSLVHDPEMLDVVVKGLSIKLLWQERLLEETGRRPILFVDEPALSGIGSAFATLNRDWVVTALRETIDYVRTRSDALIGVHCCANTDWPMVMESGPDILNFDAYGYMDSFLLYPKEILRFIQGGGTIAWGIVPTLDFKAGIDAGQLQADLEQGLDRLRSWGLDEDTLRARSMLTSACGMGSMQTDTADEALRLLSDLQERMS
ncbi:MAG: hypothetical protein PVG49_18205 [Desulfobacteraceae bacterium]|jgi:hypothetical protein